MNKNLNLIYLIFFLTLNFSCVEKEESDKEKNKTELVGNSNADTLKFNNGISSIFQDSKGNYWYGSRQEGVALFDGQTYTYFTTNKGLPDNQIRSIKEDNNGNIWFETANGISSYDGKRIANHTIIENAISQNEWTKTSNDLWFSAGNKEGVYKYDGDNIKKYTDSLGQSNGFVHRIYKDNDDELWFVLTNGDVYRFNGKIFNREF